MIPMATVTAALQRLSDVYSLPANMPREPQRLAAIYGRVLDVLPAVHPDQLDAAVSAYLASEAAYFPKPGMLRALALQQRGPSMLGASLREYLDWERDWGRSVVTDAHGHEEYAFTSCPACGATVEPGPRGLRVPHRAAVHRGQGLPVIGYSDEVAAFYAHRPAPVPVVARPDQVEAIRARIAAYEQRLAAETDPETRRLLEVSLDRWRRELEPAAEGVAA